jgi:Antitoxin MazE-like
MTITVSEQIRKRRDSLHIAGLHPVQVWVPDTRRPEFAAECRRQSKLATQRDTADVDTLKFMDEALVDVDD